MIEKQKESLCEDFERIINGYRFSICFDIKKEDWGKLKKDIEDLKNWSINLDERIKKIFEGKCV